MNLFSETNLKLNENRCHTGVGIKHLDEMLKRIYSEGQICAN